MLTTILHRIDNEDYDYFRGCLAHARTDSDIGFIAELYGTRICQVTGQKDDTLNAFFAIDTPQGRRCFTIAVNAGMTAAEFNAVTRQDIEAVDRALPAS